MQPPYTNPSLYLQWTFKCLGELLCIDPDFLYFNYSNSQFQSEPTQVAKWNNTEFLMVNPWTLEKLDQIQQWIRNIKKHLAVMISIFLQPCDCLFAKAISSIPSDLGTSLEGLSTKPNLNPNQPSIGPSSSICCNATFLSFFLTRKSRWSLGGLKKWSRIFFCSDGVDDGHLSIAGLLCFFYFWVGDIYWTANSH